tara:strand:- start:1339 stop:2073 length:735 start_codon:yes stop_codon:yes gene_type:complete
MQRLSYGIWTAVIYFEILAYTLLTQTNTTPSVRSIPVFALMGTLILFVSFLFQKFSEFKTIIMASVYSVVVSVFIVLEIFDVVDCTFVNYGVAVTAVLVSFFWCSSSHYATKTDPGWHWFVFSSVFIIAVCAAFNFENEPAQNVFIINTILIVIIQFIYIWNVMKTHAYGNKRFRHVIRVVVVGVVATVVLLGNILRRSQIISFQSLEKIVLAVEIIIGFGLIFDFCSTPATIKYTSVLENVNA